MQCVSASLILCSHSGIFVHVVILSDYCCNGKP